MSERSIPINLAERICRWSAAQPEKIAIVDGDAAWSYSALGASIETWAGRFHALGLSPGDTVLIFMTQCADAIAVYFGLMRCGAVPSFMPLPSAKQEPGYYWRSHRDLLALIGPAAVVATKADTAAMQQAGFTQLVPRLIEVDTEFAPASRWSGPSPGGADDIALLQHSSGTTALKKGVQLSHRAITQQVASYAAALKADASDVVVSWLPMYHDMGLIACTVMPLLLGQKLVLLDPFRWVAEPGTLLTAITAHGGTLCWLPNFAFELLAKTVRPDSAHIELSGMRAFVNCSEPCKPASFDRFIARFGPVGASAAMLHVCYAMAETVFAVTQSVLGQPARRLAVDAQRLASDLIAEPASHGATAIELLSAGSPVAGMSVTIVDDRGQALPDRQVGEIELASEFLFSGYLNRPEITAEKLRAGRYRTNDLGFIADGELFVLGRADDLIIVHGRNYFAHEIEAVVNDVAGLKAGRNVAVGIFNDLLGSLDAVVIAERDTDVPAPTDQGRGLKRTVKHTVAERMGLELRDVQIVEPGWLAKTSSGKISRSLNRDKYLRRAP